MHMHVHALLVGKVNFFSVDSVIDAYINAVIDAYAAELILQPATSTSVLKTMPSNLLFIYHQCIVILLVL